MSITVDTANATMNLAGGAFVFLAAVITLMVALLPKENPVEVLPRIGSGLLDFTPIVLTLASGVYSVIFDLAGTGFWLFAAATLMTAVNFIRNRTPVRRIEILLLVLQVAILTAFGLLLHINRILDTLVQAAH